MLDIGSMAKVEIEVPDNLVRFLQAMQVLWQHPQGWVNRYLSNAVLKSINSDLDEGILIDKDKLRELYNIDDEFLQELPMNKELVTP